MNILVVGRGGREHSIVSHVKKDPRVSCVYAAPGNAGIQREATCVSIDELDIEGLIDFAKEKHIDLTIVGPEAPLNKGITNHFHDEGLRVFAPTKEAALLEGSKQFAKDFMKKHRIPTAAYATFTEANLAKDYIRSQGAPIVVKADGLAEGKGVVVAMTAQEALDAVDAMMVEKTFADAGSTIVIEEFLEGKEFSLMAFVHGNNVYPMMPARDHKRAYDGDKGPNTGGMGAFAPVPDVSEEVIDYTVREIVQKTADKLVEEGRSFTGILYAGLMLPSNGMPKVIEFNTRFGDPETQVVLPLMENHLTQVLNDVLDDKDPQITWKTGSCVGVVIASSGYPVAYKKGFPLPFSEGNEDTFVVHAGTKKEGDTYVSNGGRVLLVAATGDDQATAVEKVYGIIGDRVNKDHYFYRKDIGK